MSRVEFQRSPRFVAAKNARAPSMSGSSLSWATRAFIAAAVASNLSSPQREKPAVSQKRWLPTFFTFARFFARPLGQFLLALLHGRLQRQGQGIVRKLILRKLGRDEVPPRLLQVVPVRVDVHAVDPVGRLVLVHLVDELLQPTQAALDDAVAAGT